MTVLAIPVVDLAGGLSGRPPAQWSRVTRELIAACGSVGSFYLVNHGISSAAIERAFAEVKAFFGLSEGEKMKLHARHCPPHRGYVRALERKLGSAALLDQLSAQIGDFKENFDIGPDLSPDDPAVRPGNDFYGPNVWPAAVPGLQSAIEVYRNGVLAALMVLMRCMAIGLGVQPEYFTTRANRPLVRIKLLHYPPNLSSDEPAREGVGAHTDFSFLTLIAQDGIGGLEIYDREGHTIPVEPREGALFINVGDQLSRWTNNRFWPTLHRVVNTARTDRYSMAFFMHPNFDAVIDPAEIVPPDAEPAVYPAVQAGQDLLDRLSGRYDGKTQAA